MRALITSLRNFEISNSGSEQLNQKRLENKQWKRDLKSYVDIILKRDLSNDEISTKGEKSASLNFFTPKKERSRTDPERSNADETFLPRNASEVRDGDYRDAQIIPIAKLIGLGNVTVEGSRNLIPRSKANQTLHHLDAPTASIIQDYYKRIR